MHPSSDDVWGARGQMVFKHRAVSVLIVFILAKTWPRWIQRVNAPQFTRPTALRSPCFTRCSHFPAYKTASLIILSFLERAQGSFQTLNDPEAINPPNSLGRQVNRCRTTISLGSPSAAAHPAAQIPDLYGVHSVCRPNYRWLRNGAAAD